MIYCKPNYTLTKDQKRNIIHNINITNTARMKLILTVFIIVEFLFILLNDIPNITNPAAFVRIRYRINTDKNLS